MSVPKNSAKTRRARSVLADRYRRGTPEQLVEARRNFAAATIEDTIRARLGDAGVPLSAEQVQELSQLLGGAR